MIVCNPGTNENKIAKKKSLNICIYSFEAHKIFQLFATVRLVCIQYIEITHSRNCKSELYICLLGTYVEGKTSLIMDLSERLEG